MKVKILILPAIYLLFAATGCKKASVETENGFYYWKTSPYNLNNSELNYLRELHIKKLYIKFFEVDTDPVLGNVPVSKTSLYLWNSQPEAEIIPVIFIRNKVLLTATTSSLDSLADNMFFLLNKKFHSNMNHRQYREIQIDCDWTEKTRDNYFYLLKKLKSVSGKTISCTLRLYPYKYRDKAGIPPVDKAVLMCYNLIAPLSDENKNSILSDTELEKYLVRTKKYPIHLDFAIPVFSWMHVYQNNQFAGMLPGVDIEKSSYLKPVKPLWYEVTQDTETESLFLRTGDRIKMEDVSESTVLKTITLLRKYAVNDRKHSIILFHLDSHNLSNYTHETLHSFFSALGN